MQNLHFRWDSISCAEIKKKYCQMKIRICLIEWIIPWKLIPISEFVIILKNKTKTTKTIALATKSICLDKDTILSTYLLCFIFNVTIGVNAFYSIAFIYKSINESITKHKLQVPKIFLRFNSILLNNCYHFFFLILQLTSLLLPNFEYL